MALVWLLASILLALAGEFDAAVVAVAAATIHARL